MKAVCLSVRQEFGEVNQDYGAIGTHPVAQENVLLTSAVVGLGVDELVASLLFASRRHVQTRRDDVMTQDACLTKSTGAG